MPLRPFFGRPHLQVLVYWLRELTTDTATRYAVHVSTGPVDSGATPCRRGSFFPPRVDVRCNLKSPSVPRTNSLCVILTVTATAEVADILKWCLF